MKVPSRHHTADKGRSERNFNIGDLVLVKLQACSSSLVHRSNQKLSFKFYGPFMLFYFPGSLIPRIEVVGVWFSPSTGRETPGRSTHAEAPHDNVK
jgi:hypothetical protein